MVNAIETKLSALEEQYKDSKVDRTLPTAAAYVETRDDILPWLKNTRETVDSFKPPAILDDELKEQQKEAKVFLLRLNPSSVKLMNHFYCIERVARRYLRL